MIELDTKPISAKILQIDACITLKAQRSSLNDRYWVWVEDPKENSIHFYERISFQTDKPNSKKEYEYKLSFCIPIFSETIQNLYFKVTSDKLLNCGALEIIITENLQFPPIAATQTRLLDLDPLTIEALNNKDFEKLFKFKYFLVLAFYYQNFYFTETWTLQLSSATEIKLNSQKIEGSRLGITRDGIY